MYSVLIIDIQYLTPVPFSVDVDTIGFINCPEKIRQQRIWENSRLCQNIQSAGNADGENLNTMALVLDCLYSMGLIFLGLSPWAYIKFTKSFEDNLWKKPFKRITSNVGLQIRKSTRRKYQKKQEASSGPRKVSGGNQRGSTTTSGYNTGYGNSQLYTIPASPLPPHSPLETSDDTTTLLGNGNTLSVGMNPQLRAVSPNPMSMRAGPAPVGGKKVSLMVGPNPMSKRAVSPNPMGMRAVSPNPICMKPGTAGPAPGPVQAPVTGRVSLTISPPSYPTQATPSMPPSDTARPSRTSTDATLTQRLSTTDSPSRAKSPRPARRVRGRPSASDAPAQQEGAPTSKDNETK